MLGEAPNPIHYIHVFHQKKTFSLRRYRDCDKGNDTDNRISLTNNKSKCEWSQKTIMVLTYSLSSFTLD